MKKLTREEFAACLRRGLGRARIHVDEHGLEGIEDLVIAACLRDPAYDAQDEDCRAGWLYPMFKGAPGYPRFATAVVAALRSHDDEKYSLEQLCNLASLMGKDGDAAAAQALRDVVLNRSVVAGEFLYGDTALAMLDGMEGAIAVARRYGIGLLEDPPCWCMDPSDLAPALEPEQLISRLACEAESDGDIARYLDWYREKLATHAGPRPARTSESLPAVLYAAAQSGKWPGMYAGFGRRATAAELETVLNSLLASREPEEELRLLWVFRSVAPPRLHPRLWALAKSDNGRIRNAAMTALSNIDDPAIALYARERLKDGCSLEENWELLRMFAKHYGDGDTDLILSALDGSHLTDDGAHACGKCVTQLFACAPLEDALRLAAWSYRSDPCSLCRSSAVAYAVEHAAQWPAWLDEARYDADEGTQALFAACAPGPRAGA